VRHAHQVAQGRTGIHKLGHVDNEQRHAQAAEGQIEQFQRRIQRRGHGSYFMQQQKNMQRHTA
jgi:hypothetical protein